jgi:hypothetical protein
MAAGRKAAASIIKYLTGSAPKEKETSLAETLQRAGETVNQDFPARRQRQLMPTLPLRQALSSFDEVELGYRKKNGMEEAGRCLNCAVCIRGDHSRGPAIDRLLSSRERERGGKWQRISWDEAFPVPGRLKEIKDNPGGGHPCVCGNAKASASGHEDGREALYANTHLGHYHHPDVMASSVTFGHDHL